MPADFRSQLDAIRSSPDAAATRLHSLFEAAWGHAMEESPESATVLGYRGHDHRWSDLSPDAIARSREDARASLEALRSIDASGLDEVDRLSWLLFEKGREDELESARFHPEYQPVNQLQGVQQDPAMYIEAQPAATPEDIEAIVERLRALPLLVAQSIELMRLGIAAGNTPPQVCLRDVPEQVENQLVDDPFSSPLLVPIAEVDDSRLRAAAAEAYTSRVAPAYLRFKRFLVDEYLPKTRTTIACRDLPDGEAFYRHLVRHHTTTDLTPEEIHETGLREVERIKSEMSKVSSDAGFDGFNGFADHLRTAEEHRHQTVDALLAGYRDIAKHIDARLPQLFGKLPELPYEIVAVPPYAEKSQTAAYYLPGAPDGSRPGQFFVNTYDLPARFKWEMESLTLHEAVPGHHLQIALAQELTGLPDFRRHAWFTAFGEGWGLYAESLGEELGLYADPPSRFGALMAEIWRAVRLVIDTGLHAFGWTRDQALAYFQNATGRDDHDIVVEVDRYIVWPGQALGYKIGELKINELRARAESAPSFDVRAFHDELLRHGCLPLDILEQQVASAGG